MKTQLLLPALCALLCTPASSVRAVAIQDGADVSPAAAIPGHRGPAVAPGPGGPARFVEALLGRFDARRALADAAHFDRHYRAPGNDGYEAALEHLLAELGAAGFERAGSEGAGELELEVIESELRGRAWTPLSARLEFVEPDGRREALLSFDTPEGRDRVMLPVHAPTADVRGPVVLESEALVPGAVLVTERALDPALLRRAARAGAVAVLSASLSELVRDPNGGERHLDAISFRSVPAGTELAVAQISPRVHGRIAERVAAGESFELAYQARVRFDERPLRTVVATWKGAREPGRAVVIAAHLQEPGAGDNASGAAGMLEAARVLGRHVREGSLARPARSLAFVWGDEMRQSSLWLRHSGRTALAAISADMLGQSEEATGAICLLERSKDPGAIWTLPPDEHTPWGKGRVEPDQLTPDGLALIVRTALSDVARAVGGWRTAEHPWEGGSDHDVFLARGVPAVLVWHFTDFTYHTGLDRLEMLDPLELQRSSVALVAAALAVADAGPADLGRYRASLALERELRLAAAQAAELPEAAQAWTRWFEGAERWLVELCRVPGAATTDGSGARKPEDPR